MKQLFIFLLAIFEATSLMACTNILVTKGASGDKATYLVYLNDGEWLYHLNTTAAADHPKGDSLTFRSLNGKKFKIHQVAHTYAIVGFQINEHQLAIGETTFTGRPSLWDKSKPLKYWDLMRLALLRARTAREAIKVITSLVETYGYGSEGETFSIADPNEAWLLEMVGTGGEGGAIWVARRVPNGMITAHANHSRIGTFPLNDPENCLYSKNVISYAVRKGFYNPKSGKPFAFNDVYDPPSPEHLKYTETRVWSIFRRAAPSQHFSMDYHRGISGAKPYPLFIKPDKKLNIKDIFALVRDHYEGTALDMTRMPEAGPFGNPNRVRPLDWQTDSADYSWERPISTYNTAFSFVAQLRNYLPDDVGGLIWFGEDDTYTNCYFPIYCSVNDVAAPYKTGDINHYSAQSAWWTFNLVANYANIRYQDMVKDIRKVQKTLENTLIHRQDSIEKIALGKQGQARRKFLTEYSKSAGMLVYEHWLALANQLITQFNDGYIKQNGRVEAVPYPEKWRNYIIRQNPEKHKIRKWHNEKSLKEKPF